MSEFKASYHIEGGDRPQYFRIDASDVGDLDDEELSELFDDMMREDFEHSILPCEDNKEAFMRWARGVRDGGE